MMAPFDLPGLPGGAVTRWLAATLGDAGPGDSYAAEVISGGLSNITYRLRWGGRRLVLRRPPLSQALPRAHDVQREYRVLSALVGTAVPVPAAIAFCADPGVLGAPFYLMDEVPGAVLRSPADTQALATGQRRELSAALVDVLGALHAVDPGSVGLADFGRPGGYASRQLRTWGTQWQRSATRDLPDMERLLSRLADAVPSAEETTIVHGDYRLDNTIVTLSPQPRIAAVLDWELSTLGEPVADLATMLTYWHDPGDAERAEIAVAAGLTALPGFLTTDELAQRYAVTTGRDLSALTFYRALATMKLAVILEGVHRRHLGGQAVGAGYDRVGPAVPLLAARGLRLLAGGDQRD
jgi:aminoglycoside phosphotransferase (APT) family kinase protein